MKSTEEFDVLADEILELICDRHNVIALRLQVLAEDPEYVAQVHAHGIEELLWNGWLFKFISKWNDKSVYMNTDKVLNTTIWYEGEKDDQNVAARVNLADPDAFEKISAIINHLLQE